MAKKLVQGVGKYIFGNHSCRVAGKATKEYRLWEKMLERCYSEKLHKRMPTYLGCSVSEDFKDFQGFAEWVNKQVGFNVDGFQLDKDLLQRGNKVYGEDTCLFIPALLNTLLVKSDAIRGDCPIGVYNLKGVFVAKMKVGLGEAQYLGSFPTPEAAFAAYKLAKESFIKQRANEYRDQIDPRAYAALMAYEILITD